MLRFLNRIVKFFLIDDVKYIAYVGERCLSIYLPNGQLVGKADLADGWYRSVEATEKVAKCIASLGIKKRCSFDITVSGAYVLGGVFTVPSDIKQKDLESYLRWRMEVDFCVSDISLSFADLGDGISKAACISSDVLVGLKNIFANYYIDSINDVYMALGNIRHAVFIDEIDCCSMSVPLNSQEYVFIGGVCSSDGSNIDDGFISILDFYECTYSSESGEICNQSGIPFDRVSFDSIIFSGDM